MKNKLFLILLLGIALSNMGGASIAATQFEKDISVFLPNGDVRWALAIECLVSV